MTTNRTLQSIAILITSNPDELHFIKRVNDALKSEFRPPLGASVICKAFQVHIPDSLKELFLPANEKREPRLESFLANFTTHRIDWICEVRCTEWNEQCWRSKAVEHHLKAESVGIYSTTSSAVIAASMQFQGFPPPPALHQLLWLAKQLPMAETVATEVGHNQETAKTKRES